MKTKIDVEHYYSSSPYDGPKLCSNLKKDGALAAQVVQYKNACYSVLTVREVTQDEHSTC